MYTALVVDDHPFIRSSVKMLLSQVQFEVVAEANNGADAVQLARKHIPDLIILDIGMPKLDGLEVLNRIASLRLPSKILVFTSQSALFFAMRCMKAGAAGFISKTNNMEEMTQAIRTVMDGYTFFPSLASNSVRAGDVETSDRELIKSLSDRELTILQQLSQGLSNKEIGAALLISNKTVSTYKTRLIEKLNVKSVVYMADFAKRNNLI